MIAILHWKIAPTYDSITIDMITVVIKTYEREHDHGKLSSRPAGIGGP
jgi:hypothetical protein